MISGAFLGIVKFDTRFNITSSTFSGSGSCRKKASRGVTSCSLRCLICLMKHSASCFCYLTWWGLPLVRPMSMMLTWWRTKDSATRFRSLPEESWWTRESVRQSTQRRLAYLNYSWWRELCKLETMEVSWIIAIVRSRRDLSSFLAEAALETWRCYSNSCTTWVSALGNSLLDMASASSKASWSTWFLSYAKFESLWTSEKIRRSLEPNLIRLTRS